MNSGADIQKTRLALKHFTKFLAVLAMVAGCSEEERLINDTDMAYFPFQTGLFRIYTVQETRHTPGEEPLELNYELMTVVADSFPSQDHYTYVIHRSRRASETAPWEPLDTWSARKDRHAVIIAEGNTSFVKARFPISPDHRWDGNALNSMGHDEYAFADIHQPMQIDGMTFEKTVTVEEERNEDPIVFRDERREVYAMGIGLVYRETTQLNYCTDDTCLGQQKIEEGFEMKVAIKQYGRH